MTSVREIGVAARMVIVTLGLQSAGLAALDKRDVQEMHGVRVTRPLKTIVDLLQSGHVDRSQLKRAVDEAVRRGLVGRKEIDRMPHDKLHGSLRELAGQHA